MGGGAVAMKAPEVQKPDADIRGIRDVDRIRVLVLGKIEEDLKGPLSQNDKMQATGFLIALKNPSGRADMERITDDALRFDYRVRKEEYEQKTRELSKKLKFTQAYLDRLVLELEEDYGKLNSEKMSRKDFNEKWAPLAGMKDVLVFGLGGRTGMDPVEARISEMYDLAGNAQGLFENLKTALTLRIDDGKKGVLADDVLSRADAQLDVCLYYMRDRLLAESKQQSKKWFEKKEDRVVAADKMRYYLAGMEHAKNSTIFYAKETDESGTLLLSDKQLEKIDSRAREIEDILAIARKQVDSYEKTGAQPEWIRGQMAVSRSGKLGPIETEARPVPTDLVAELKSFEVEACRMVDNEKMKILADKENWSKLRKGWEYYGKDSFDAVVLIASLVPQTKAIAAPFARYWFAYRTAQQGEMALRTRNMEQIFSTVLMGAAMCGKGVFMRFGMAEESATAVSGLAGKMVTAQMSVSGVVIAANMAEYGFNHRDMAELVRVGIFAAVPSLYKGKAKGEAAMSEGKSPVEYVMRVLAKNPFRERTGGFKPIGEAIAEISAKEPTAASIGTPVKTTPTGVELGLVQGGKTEGGGPKKPGQRKVETEPKKSNVIPIEEAMAKQKRVMTEQPQEQIKQLAVGAEEFGSPTAKKGGEPPGRGPAPTVKMPSGGRRVGEAAPKAEAGGAAKAGEKPAGEGAATETKAGESVGKATLDGKFENEMMAIRGTRNPFLKIGRGVKARVIGTLLFPKGIVESARESKKQTQAEKARAEENLKTVGDFEVEGKPRANPIIRVGRGFRDFLVPLAGKMASGKGKGALKTLGQGTGLGQLGKKIFKGKTWVDELKTSEDAVNAANGISSVTGEQGAYAERLAETATRQVGAINLPPRVKPLILPLLIAGGTAWTIYQKKDLTEFAERLAETATGKDLTEFKLSGLDIAGITLGAAVGSLWVAQGLRAFDGKTLVSVKHEGLEAPIRSAATTALIALAGYELFTAAVNKYRKNGPSELGGVIYAEDIPYVVLVSIASPFIAAGWSGYMQNRAQKFLRFAAIPENAKRLGEFTKYAEEAGWTPGQIQNGWYKIWRTSEVHGPEGARWQTAKLMAKSPVTAEQVMRKNRETGGAQGFNFATRDPGDAGLGEFFGLRTYRSRFKAYFGDFSDIALEKKLTTKAKRLATLPLREPVRQVRAFKNAVAWGAFRGKEAKIIEKFMREKHAELNEKMAEIRSRAYREMRAKNRVEFTDAEWNRYKIETRKMAESMLKEYMQGKVKEKEMKQSDVDKIVENREKSVQKMEERIRKMEEGGWLKNRWKRMRNRGEEVKPEEGGENPKAGAVDDDAGTPEQ